LLQEAQRLATLHGAGNLHLLVARDNRAVRRAYERRGFKPVHLEVMVLEL
jgi:ribosomal protein S18 acetylase RimI-like enzyme